MVKRYCSYCKVEFEGNIEDFKSHVLSHLKSIRCSECGKCYRKVCSLEKHKQEEHAGGATKDREDDPPKTTERQKEIDNDEDAGPSNVQDLGKDL